MATAAVPGRPDDSEFTSWAKDYVECVEGSDIVQALTSQLKDYVALVAPLDAGFRYAPGKWSVSEIAGHVNDTERVFAYRLLCVARNDTTAFPPFDQDAYLAHAGSGDRSLADLLDEFQVIRQSTIHLVRTLPSEAWLRRGTVSGCSVTPRGLAFQLAGHERHHSRILREKYVTQ